MLEITLEKIIKELKEEYEFAKKQGWIKKPISYALYEVWKRANENEGKKERRC